MQTRRTVLARLTLWPVALASVRLRAGASSLTPDGRAVVVAPAVVDVFVDHRGWIIPGADRDALRDALRAADRTATVAAPGHRPGAGR